MAPPNSALPPDDDKARDDAYNPSEQAYLENTATGTPRPYKDKSEAESVKESEEKGDGNIAGGLYKPSPEGKKSKFSGKGLLKRKGPLAAIISLVFGAGLGFSALASPSLLIVHMKEIMVDKFNTSIASADIRTNKVLNMKIEETTKGVCTTKVTILCKFSTMSEKQVANFKAAGIDVEPDDRQPLLGKRTKPLAYNYTDSKGTTHRITAADFEKLSKSDEGFRLALKKGYNPKYGTTSGSGWKRLARSVGLSKADPKPAKDDTERAARLNEETKNGMKSGTVSAEDFKNEGCDQACADDKAAKANKYGEAVNAEPNTRTKAGNAAVESVIDGLSGNGAAISGLTNSLKITGIADYACQAYGAIQAVGYAAKTVRALQLARYAMAFMKTADMIKAGTAKPEDVAYMGGILTEITYDASSAVKRTTKFGSATDSSGFKYAAFGDTGGKKSSMTLAGQFLAGGGLTGDLINMSNAVADTLGGQKTARSTCAFLGNPWVGAGSAIIGLAFMAIPGVGQAGSALKLAGQAAIGVSVQVGLAILPNLLKDIVAGTVTENISGEAAGNAWTSGSGKMLSDSLASFNGNAPMSKTDALAYDNLQNEILAQYAQEDSDTLSPLDATNRHTFLGNIVFQLLPQTASLSSPSSIVSSFSSLISGSFAKLLPNSNAVTTKQKEDSLNTCQDYDYTQLGIATDPFCNVIRGIPPQYLNKDPKVVMAELGSEINETTGEPQGNYATFVKDCITNENPPGYTDGGLQEDDGGKCIINPDNANYYLYWTDRRLNAAMSGEEESDPTTPNSGISGDAKSLAKQILESGNVTQAPDGDDGDGPGELAQLQMTADGTATGNCLVDTRVLKLIAGLAQKHKLVISDLGRECNGSRLSRTGSTHWESPNIAVDFDRIDDNGNPDTDVQLINEALGYVDSGQTVYVGQIDSKGRGGGNLTAPAGVTVREFSDAPGHLHINFSS